MSSFKRLPYQDFPFISALMQDYADKKQVLKPFIKDFPTVEGLVNYAQQKTLSSEIRQSLYQVLSDQYKGIHTSVRTQFNIDALKQNNAFTITTGHQLCLFTGPLYFIYKIASTINLANQCHFKDPKSIYVPVFWMATEDHDFEEINHFNGRKQTFAWETKEHGGVGRMNPQDVLKLTDTLKKEFGLTLNGQKLLDLFKQAYKQTTLSKATHYLVNELFGHYGLVILDADDKRLKQWAIPCFEKEIKEEAVLKAYSKMEKKWPKTYKKQVNARACNLFYLDDNFRGRLIKNTHQVWEANGRDGLINESDLIADLYENPEKFSPNVLMRPMYQEIILPNLAYIGGGGEIAYWFLLKEIFEEFSIDFPYLILRNSVLNISPKIQNKIENGGFNWKDVLLSESDFIAQYANNNYSNNQGIQEVKEQLDQFWLSLQSEYPDLLASFEHREKHIGKMLDKTEVTLKRKWKSNQNELVTRFSEAKSKVFPNGKFQERYSNFFDQYIIDGDCFIQNLIHNCDVFNGGILIHSTEKTDCAQTPLID